MPKYLVGKISADHRVFDCLSSIYGLSQSAEAEAIKSLGILYRAGSRWTSRTGVPNLDPGGNTVPSEKVNFFVFRCSETAENVSTLSLSSEEPGVVESSSLLKETIHLH